MLAQELSAAEPAAVGASGCSSVGDGRVLPLIAELERTSTSFLQPLTFFVSWQGVLTLAYRGFTQPLIDLKERISSAHPGLPPENPGSKWPKTSLGCLRDGLRLTPDQLATLCQICREESAPFQHQQPPGAAAATRNGTLLHRVQQQHQDLQHRQQEQQHGQQQGQQHTSDGLKLAIDSAEVVVFECRSLERLLSCQHITFQGPVDEVEPSIEEQRRVAAIVAEADSPDYWFAASRDGNREAHYRGVHLGATLMHPLAPAAMLAAAAAAHGGEDSEAHAARPGLRARGLQELTDRRALLAAIQRFRRRVDSALPGMYAWFADSSLHITLRAVIN